MTDFASVLRQSLKHRRATSPDERERIYAHARALMIRKLWSMQPPLSSAEIDENVRRFNAAVDQVEREQAGRRRQVDTGPRYDWGGENARPVRRRAPVNGHEAAIRTHAPEAGDHHSGARAPARNDDAYRRQAATSGGLAEAERRVPRRLPPAEPGARSRRQEPSAPRPDPQPRPSQRPHDRWRDPELDRPDLGSPVPRIGPPSSSRGDNRYDAPYIDARADDYSVNRNFDSELEDFTEDSARRKPRRRRSRFGRLFAIGITGLAAVIALWCVTVFYPILFPINQSGQVDAQTPSAAAELRPIPPARQVLAPPGEGGVTTQTAAQGPASTPAALVAATQTRQAAPAPQIDTQTQESYIVFDGRDPTVFDAVSDNPIQFNGDIQGGFARITSTAGSDGVRAIVGPGLAQKLAGRRVRIVVVARSSLLGGAGSIRIAYESGPTLSPWKNVQISPDYEPIELIWEIPADASARGNHYVLIEPGLPGDGSSADIRWIRIETLPS